MSPQSQLSGCHVVSGAKHVTAAWVREKTAPHFCTHLGSEGQACGQCPGCHWFTDANHLDYLAVVPSGTLPQIKMDHIRTIIQFLSLTPKYAPFRVVVLWEAEKLTLAASNAFLKTLEEPPARCLIVLVTEYPGMLLPTIRSRCFLRRLSDGGHSAASVLSDADTTVLSHLRDLWCQPSGVCTVVEKLMKLLSLQEVLYSLLKIGYGMASMRSEKACSTSLGWSESEKGWLVEMKRDLGLNLWDWVDGVYDAVRAVQSGVTLNATLQLESLFIRSQMLRKQGSRVLDGKRIISYH